MLGHVGEEDVRRLAAKFERHRNEIVGGVLHDEPARRRLACERDLGDALALRERLASLDAEAIDDVDDARRKDIGDEFHHDHDAERRLLGWLQNDAVSCRDGGRKLPRRHQKRKIPRNDLADDAERFMVVVGDSVVVDLGDAAFLSAHHAGEIAPMVDGERQVGMGGFADRLAVVESLDEGEQIEVGLRSGRRSCS